MIAAMAGAHADQRTFGEIVQDKLPKLAHHVRDRFSPLPPCLACLVMRLETTHGELDGVTLWKCLYVYVSVEMCVVCGDED